MTTVTIFGQPGCVNCEQAKMLAKRKNINVAYYDIVTNPAARTEMDRLVLAATNNIPRSVPQIFVDGTYVGDYNKFAAWVTKNA